MSCWRCQTEASPPFCSQCEALLPPPADQTHFEVLGFSPSPVMEDAALRAKFLELSKKLHPDRFTTADGPQPLYSTRWSSMVNKAYQTLRDPALCTDYLLELNHIKPPKNVPADLAETYFELQDLEDRTKMDEFSVFLSKAIEKSAKDRDALNARWKKNEPKDTLLKQLSENVNREKYLVSMQRDLQTRRGSA